jgi:hypothetical protein
MFEFTASVDDLKKALSVVALATVETAEDVQSHALCSYSSKKEPVAKLYLSSSDKDKMALSQIPITDVKTSDSKGIEFTADPKRLQTLISNSDSKQIKFTYDSETKTLNVYASEDSDAYVSFASFDPDEFLSFEKELEATFDVKTFNPTVFLTAVRFIQGFLPNDDKEKKFSNMFFDKGIVYGTNGSNRIGAFKSEDFADISNMTIRRVMLAPIASMLDKIEAPSIKLKASDKIIAVTSSDNAHSFGFRRSVMPMPKMPISMEVPKLDGFNIDRSMLLKKLNRLSVASREDVGLKMSLKNGDKTELLIETETDRKSHEKLTCQRLSGSAELEFYLECSKLKTVLGLFQASNVDMYIDKTKSLIYSSASLLVQQDNVEVKKPFISVGLVALGKRI